MIHYLQTGAGTTASRLGMADLGIAQLSDMREHADMIANLDRSVPLIADMDTGYGGKLSYRFSQAMTPLWETLTDLQAQSW